MIIIYYLTILRLKTLSALYKEDLQKSFPVFHAFAAVIKCIYEL